MRYRNVGKHSEDVADGRTVAPGEYIDLSGDHPHDKRKIDAGVLLAVPPPKEKKKSGKPTVVAPLSEEGKAEEGKEE